MSNNTQVDVSFIFSLAAFIGLVINIILTIRRDNKANNKERDYTNEGIIKANMKLDQICTTTNGMVLQMDKMNEKMNTMALKQENHETRIRMLEDSK